MESGGLVLVWDVSLLLLRLSCLVFLYFCLDLVSVLADQVKFPVNTLDRVPWKVNLQRVFIYLARHTFKSFLASPFPVLPRGESVE